MKPSSNNDGRPTTRLPSLTAAELATFIAVSVLLALTNVYTMLLTGWGIGGSIIAVLAVFTSLRLLQRRRADVTTLNLGQTMGSSSGYIGAIVASFAAVKLVDPSFQGSAPTLIVLFAATGLLGALLGASIRRYLVRGFFPSGTACAVVQRTLEQKPSVADNGEARMLGFSAAVAALVTLPAKLASSPAGQAFIQPLALGKNLVLLADPLPYGIGLVVGPRVGIGLLLGGLSAPYVLQPLLTRAGIPPEIHPDWARWLAIAVLALPTFATIVFTYFFRVAPRVPAGFEPGRVHYRRPRRMLRAYGGIAVISLVIATLAAQRTFGVPLAITLLILFISWPLCIINSRVTADTDINPLPLLVFFLLTLTSAIASSVSTVALVGISLIGATLATIAVDMVQDFRTGFLLDANPFHQTAMQLVGAVIGAAVSVPFILFLDTNFGFGEGTMFPAPTAAMVAAMAKTFTGSGLDDALATTIGIVSTGGCIYAFLSVWPVTARWLPSLFGIGIGLLLPLPLSIAMFVGSIFGGLLSRSSKSDDKALNRPLLVGSAILAGAAITSVLVVVLTESLAALGMRWFFIATQ